MSVFSSVTGQIHIQFTAQASKGYTIQFKNALNDAAWQKVADIPPEAGAHPVDVTDNVGTSAQRFYRVITPVQP